MSEDGWLPLMEGAVHEGEDPGPGTATAVVESIPHPLTSHILSHPTAAFVECSVHSCLTFPPAACSVKGICYLQWTATCCELAK